MTLSQYWVERRTMCKKMTACCTAAIRPLPFDLLEYSKGPKLSSTPSVVDPKLRKQAPIESQSLQDLCFHVFSEFP
ncbi:hypothetical protein SCLCIDRAFT_710166 [Scleroderma citrinum Foug A]|uniref:Uncharacterized protein n=1 Tax=Scleroderma citrinum Foug A TaxID=1036808 RepID=A0A0C3E9U3_9AGAM|nr:hypothetical protein SCLCIDRAFT_710166 [Scleroderma citrinum Foug A]